jgi:DMSO/TMAO reductase YedYZ molybdopterin-dependent catalytic subunit
MDITDEGAYDRLRAAQWSAHDGMSRRALLRVSAGIGMGTTVAGGIPSARAAQAAESADSPIVKPLPPELFVVYGTNAEMRWEAMRGQGYHTPNDRFFVRDHTSTPLIDVRTWRLRLFGTGLHRSPTLDRAVEFSYEDLLGLPAKETSAFIECTGNGRGFFTTQQGQSVPGSPWTLGGVGVARWRGVPLSIVLERAGLTEQAVDVMPRGLDPDFVDAGQNHGRVRRPLPVAKALDDVLLAYEMNGRPLPPDHGFPVRLVVPSWVGVSSIKWVGDIEVSDAPLFSPWNTQYYRLFGPGNPSGGSAPLARQMIKSAFELPWDATVSADRTTVLRGRSWSGGGAVRTVDVSTDGGASWQRAHTHGPGEAEGWLRWELPWRPEGTGAHTLLARATDSTGASQPDVARYNTLGYLFDAVVQHPVTVA